MPNRLLGRDSELEGVEQFLDEVPSGLRSLALTGPAGIGKTTVWREATRRAVERGYTVLAAQPSEAERALSAVAVADLFAEVDRQVFDDLPSAQLHALDVEVLGAERDPGLLAPRALAAGCLSVLRSLSRSQPLIVAVDDAQWLDDTTSEILAYALRRLERSPVGVLVSVRLDPDRPPTFDTGLAIDLRRDLTIGPLSVAVLQDIIKRQTHQELTRPTLVRIAGACQGNPFYAIEIARELERVGLPSPAQPLPVPSGLQGLVRSRMNRLPAVTQDALLVAACSSHRGGVSVDLDAIGPAEEAGIVTVSDDGGVRFTHPLLASAVIASFSTARRRSVHRLLAEQTDDPEEKALHLAAASIGRDARVAAALDAAAARAGERAARSSVELGRQALEMTPPGDDEQFGKRVVALAHYARVTGAGVPDLSELIESALAVITSTGLRCELLLTKASLAWNDNDVETAYRSALEVVGAARNPIQTARAHFAIVWSDVDDPATGLEHLDAILEIIDEADDPLLYATASMHRAYVRLLSGQGADDEAVERGREIEARVAPRGWWDRSPVPIIWPLLKDELTEAVRVHIEHLDWARQVGDAGIEYSMLSFLCQIELLRGNYAAAVRWCDEFSELVQQTDTEVWQRNAFYNRALLAAHAGDLDLAADLAEQALALGQKGGKTIAAEVMARQVLGLVALCRDDHAVAAGHLGLAAAILERIGQREPAQWRFQPDLVEALLGAGDADSAEHATAALEERATVFPRPWTVAVSARCRAQMLAHRGNLAAAASALDTALEHHSRLEMPYELGRTLLVKGLVLRRQNERRAARATLEHAIDVFEGAGSLIWADRTRAELKRIPVRRKHEGLTATEETVARLAAEGCTTRQIAERAFISPKTVEGNLTRIYLKLGVHSRAELVRAMTDLDRAAR